MTEEQKGQNQNTEQAALHDESPKPDALETDNAAKAQQTGYQRPQRPRKRRWLPSFFALGFAVLAMLTIGALAVYLYLSYRRGSLDAADIGLVKAGVVLTAAFSLLSAALAILAFILRKQKKTMAILAVVFSTLLLLLCGGAAYLYYYSFGGLQTDAAFNALDDKELYVVVTQPDGQLIPGNVPENTATQEEIDAAANLEEVEWEYLTDGDLPQETLDAIHPVKPINHSYLLDGSEQISNYLLLGLDERGSSDSVMIFSVDRYHHKLKMISIPRDSYVRIPQFGSYAKLAYAYNWGGAAWSVGTVNQNFSLNVTDYISVDFEQLAKIIDYVGGVTVEMNDKEAYYLRGFPGVHTGSCLLGGETTVHYARIRADSELNRTGRQREVLQAVLNTVKQMPATDYPALIRYCLGSCQTSFTADNLLELALEAVQNGYTIEQYSVLNMVDYWGGKLGKEQYFYCVYDMGIASDRVYRTIYEELYVSGYPEDSVKPEE